MIINNNNNNNDNNNIDTCTLSTAPNVLPYPCTFTQYMHAHVPACSHAHRHACTQQGTHLDMPSGHLEVVLGLVRHCCALGCRYFLWTLQCREFRLCLLQLLPRLVLHC